MRLGPPIKAQTTALASESAELRKPDAYRREAAGTNSPNSASPVVFPEGTARRQPL